MLALIGYFYLWIVALTSRVNLVSTHPESLSMFQETRPAIYTFWFKHIFFLAYYLSLKKLAILMTPKQKTDFITRLTRLVGLKVAIGSYEGGGRHALLNLVDELKQGRPVALSADGAYGTSHQCKASCFILAQQANVPLIPIGWKATFQFKWKIAGQWVTIPLPLNTIQITIGKPLVINRHFLLEELEGTRSLLTKELGLV